MSDDPFVLVSLKDDKAKKLANALNNKSADKILAYLANKKDATEADIAKSLKIPVSTVNYTMKVLIDAKLVTANEYSYSKKGREVNHYKLARKYIIIAPDEEKTTFLDSLRKYLPAFGITVGVAAVIRVFQSFTGSTALAKTDMTESAFMIAEDGARAMPMAADAAVQEVAPATTQLAPVVQHSPDWIVMFMLGTAVLLLVLIIRDLLKR